MRAPAKLAPAPAVQSRMPRRFATALVLGACACLAGAAPAHAAARSYDVLHQPLPRLASPPGPTEIVRVVPLGGDFDGDHKRDMAVELTRCNRHSHNCRDLVAVVRAAPRGGGVQRLRTRTVTTAIARKRIGALATAGDVNGDGLEDLAVSDRADVRIVLGGRRR